MGAERDWLYRNHGIGVDAEGNVWHDLEDIHVIEVRNKALEEIQSLIDRAAPGAVRIKRLETAKSSILKRVLSRAEDKIRRRKVAEHLLANMRNPKNHLGDTSSAAYRLLDLDDEGITGMLNKGEKLKDTLTDAEAKEADDILQEYSRVMDETNYEIDNSAEEEALRWSQKHGSDRLKALIREKIEWDRVYADERLQHDRPNWKWSHDVCGKLQAPAGTSVTQDHLAALERAREIAPDAKLSWLGKGQHTKECTLRTKPCRDLQQMVLRADFLGRIIVREMDGYEGVPF